MGTQQNILLFGGTSEGRELTALLAQAGIFVCVSVATERGARDFFVESPFVTFHQGTLTQDEKVHLMSKVSAVVDATHPYAQSISAHVRAAAEQAHKPYIRVLRPPSDTQGCMLAPTLEKAVSLIPEAGNVLATTGAKELAAYRALPHFKERLFVRILDDAASLEKALATGLAREHIVVGRGPFSEASNKELIERFHIKTLVTKESGEAGGYPEKLAAARACNVQVIVIARPAEKDGMLVSVAFDYITQHILVPNNALVPNKEVSA